MTIAIKFNPVEKGPDKACEDYLLAFADGHVGTGWYRPDGSWSTDEDGFNEIDAEGIIGWAECTNLV